MNFLVITENAKLTVNLKTKTQASTQVIKLFKSVE